MGRLQGRFSAFLHTNISFLQREIARYTFSPSYTPIYPSSKGRLQDRFSPFLHTNISFLQREIARYTFSPFLHTNISFLQREIARYTFSFSSTLKYHYFKGRLQCRFSPFLHQYIFPSEGDCKVGSPIPTHQYILPSEGDCKVGSFEVLYQLLCS